MQDKKINKIDTDNLSTISGIYNIKNIFLLFVCIISTWSFALQFNKSIHQLSTKTIGNIKDNDDNDDRSVCSQTVVIHVLILQSRITFVSTSHLAIIVDINDPAKTHKFHCLDAHELMTHWKIFVENIIRQLFRSS